METNIENEPKIIQTDLGAKDGQTKCPKCGATDISVNSKNGKLRCNFCRHEFEPEKLEGMEKDINNLEGEVIGSGATDILEDIQDAITLKCTSCGAEVVIDTSETTNCRCHWCRNTLSINEQIPNGSVPDTVLPFKLSKQDAQKDIENFVAKRKFFAHPKFKEEFTTNNIMGVYLPYMIVDANAHASFEGQGEHETRRYTVSSGEHEETYYDADAYQVGRDFDLTIEGLTIESSSDKLNKKSELKTNNIINSIMPFDIENCVKWDANYLKGYTSEKRDTNVEQLSNIVDTQLTDIARYSANDTLKHYDRGVCWRKQDVDIKGRQWKTAYLPVWLYSYQEVKGNQKLLHYVAVNSRTRETMGSIPIHMPKLIGYSLLVEVIGLFLSLFTSDSDISWIFLFSGIIYFGIMYSRYRNKDARHSHEKETKNTKSNIVAKDEFIGKRKKLSSPRIQGANNTSVHG